MHLTGGLRSMTGPAQLEESINWLLVALISKSSTDLQYARRELRAIICTGVEKVQIKVCTSFTPVP